MQVDDEGNQLAMLKGTVPIDMPQTSQSAEHCGRAVAVQLLSYKAVLLAAGTLPKMFPMLMTAAGTVAAARVFIIGAGVAGLQAIATSRRLGAVVRAYDVRPAVKEQVESLGAKFVEMELESEQAEGAGGYAKQMPPEYFEKQKAVVAEHIKKQDIVITTALIPGRSAPVLVTKEMVGTMSAGSVIIDLAVEAGGNVEGSKFGAVVTTANGNTFTIDLHQLPG